MMNATDALWPSALRFGASIAIASLVTGSIFVTLSKRKAITAQSPKPGFTVNPPARFRRDRVNAIVRKCASRVCRVRLRAQSLRNVRWGVPIVIFHRRPVRTDGQWRRGQFREILDCVHYFTPDDREHRFESFDLFFGDRKIIR